MVRFDHGDVVDIKGSKTTELIANPMRQAGRLALSENEEESGILETIQQIEDLKTDNSRALSILNKTLPTSFNVLAECEEHMQRLQEADDEDEEKYREVIQRAKKQQALKAQLKANDALHAYVKKFKLVCRRDNDKTLWDMDNLYCVSLLDEILPVSDPTRELVRVEFIGYANDLEGKIFDLAQKDIKAITNLGLYSFLAQKYIDIESE